MTTHVHQGDTNFGYLPVKTLLLAFAVALLFRIAGWDAKFLEGNASWPNLAMAIMMTSVLIVIYFFTALHPYDGNKFMQGVRKLIVEYVKFSFELGFFAIGFIIVVEYGYVGYWELLLVWLPVYLLMFIAFNHVLLLVHGGTGATIRLANWVDEKKGWKLNVTIVGNSDACRMLGMCFTIVFGAALVYVIKL
ncbi:hypothetical protein [Pseudomonas sp. RC3H12]|uniref:hypothetical protein n=1 Tax=Pseudomonas sp. RC3H12 TaxID=2834406 RepID=UPI001BDE0C88|nr:hypothetical protein [Pseudomonas sp. RC3H12]QWA30514.1 hypothetical protein KHO27_06460 [Pseudomonas sp. RC3H12]